MSHNGLFKFNKVGALNSEILRLDSIELSQSHTKAIRDAVRVFNYVCDRLNKVEDINYFNSLSTEPFPQIWLG
jgi:hypothetical protein